MGHRFFLTARRLVAARSVALPIGSMVVCREPANQNVSSAVGQLGSDA